MSFCQTRRQLTLGRVALRRKSPVFIASNSSFLKHDSDVAKRQGESAHNGNLIISPSSPPPVAWFRGFNSPFPSASSSHAIAIMRPFLRVTHSFGRKMGDTCRQLALPVCNSYHNSEDLRRLKPTPSERQRGLVQARKEGASCLHSIVCRLVRKERTP